jgi:hypothetical protein
MVGQVKDGRSIWLALDPAKVVALDYAATNLAAEAIEAAGIPTMLTLAIEDAPELHSNDQIQSADLPQAIQQIKESVNWNFAQYQCSGARRT